MTLSVPQVALVLGVSRAGAYKLAARGDFPSFRIGSRIVVPKEQLIRRIDAQTEGG